MGARRGIGAFALDEMRVGAKDSVRLEFVSGSSSKFWQLTKLPNDMFLAEWGRIGSRPQAQKEYTSHEARKKIAEKIGKGYQEVGRAEDQRPSEQIAAKLRMDKKRASKKGAIDFMKELRSIKYENED